jgi:hypothetical protein
MGARFGGFGCCALCPIGEETNSLNHPEITTARQIGPIDAAGEGRATTRHRNAAGSWFVH